MSDGQDSRRNVEPAIEAAPRKSSRGKAARANRREVVKATVAIAGGVAAASYVKPALEGLGIPAALAVSGLTVAPKCSINLSATASCTKNANGTYSVTGTIAVTTDASATECCPVQCVTVYTLTTNLGGAGGCNTSQLTACSPPSVGTAITSTNNGTTLGYINGEVTGNTGGSNPIINSNATGTTGTCLPSSTTGFTYAITTSGAEATTAPVLVVIEVTLIDTANGQTYQYCTDVTC